MFKFRHGIVSSLAKISLVFFYDFFFSHFFFKADITVHEIEQMHFKIIQLFPTVVSVSSK